jgi:hypothetical protein
MPRAKTLWARFSLLDHLRDGFVDTAAEAGRVPERTAGQVKAPETSQAASMPFSSGASRTGLSAEIRKLGRVAPTCRRG